MRKFKKFSLFLLIIGIGFFATSYKSKQNDKNLDFYDKIKDYDLTVIFNPDSFLAEDVEKVKRAEPIGFIGENYQRFHIHFISVVQNNENPYEYLVYGKTKVKNNICEFQGIIKIKEAKFLEVSDFPEYREGYIVSELKLFENKNQKNAGFITGKLTSNFYLDKKNVLKYNGLAAIADGFNNNQFVGTWIGYEAKLAKKCNWGDYRIPDSKELDQGTGEFSVSDKYRKNGWENFINAWGYPQNDESTKAKENENLKWWK